MIINCNKFNLNLVLMTICYLITKSFEINLLTWSMDILLVKQQTIPFFTVYG